MPTYTRQSSGSAYGGCGELKEYESFVFKLVSSCINLSSLLGVYKLTACAPEFENYMCFLRRLQLNKWSFDSVLSLIYSLRLLKKLRAWCVPRISLSLFSQWEGSVSRYESRGTNHEARGVNTIYHALRFSICQWPQKECCICRWSNLSYNDRPRVTMTFQFLLRYVALPTLPCLYHYSLQRDDRYSLSPTVLVSCFCTSRIRGLCSRRTIPWDEPREGRASGPALWATRGTARISTTYPSHHLLGWSVTFPSWHGNRATLRLSYAVDVHGSAKKAVARGRSRPSQCAFFSWVSHLPVSLSRCRDLAIRDISLYINK